MHSPAGYLSIVGAVVFAALLLTMLRFLMLHRRQIKSRLRPAELRFELGFPGLADFAAAHGWSGPRGDLALDRAEIATVFDLLDAGDAHVSLTYACTGHYRGMGILMGDAVVTAGSGATSEIGVVVVTLPYLLPKRHTVDTAAAVVEAIARRDDWTVVFASGRLICVRHAPFESVADLARTLDALAAVVNAVPADLVARFTVVLPRLPDGRLSDPHDAESLDAALAQMTPAERAAVLDQMRGLRRSKPR